MKTGIHPVQCPFLYVLIEGFFLISVLTQSCPQVRVYNFLWKCTCNRQALKIWMRLNSFIVIKHLSLCAQLARPRDLNAPHKKPAWPRNQLRSRTKGQVPKEDPVSPVLECEGHRKASVQRPCHALGQPQQKGV